VRVALKEIGVTDFVCDVDEDLRSACEGLGYFREHQGKAYCVLHYPGEKRAAKFEEAKQRKLLQKDYDFGGVVFPKGTSDFRETEFDATATFFDATFSGRADFSSVRFSGESTYFNEATFWNKLSFIGANFKEKVDFVGSKANPVLGSVDWAWFNGSRIEKQELLTFDNVLLHPGWFINTDVRRIDFTDVKWYGLPGGPKGTLDEELSAVDEHNAEGRHTLLAQACRRFSANAEQNREYPLANEFHYWSMDALRKGDWSFYKDLTWRDLLKWRSWPAIVKHFGLITTLYWALSGYGVRAARAFWILVALCAAFALLYMMSGPPKLQDLGRAVVYSLGAAARLNPEPKPNEPGLFQFLVIAEGLLGPLQIGLLLLAVRRKVMR
jgi:hypothetical protein